jgi:Uma2 family endonuclease
MTLLTSSSASPAQPRPRRWTVDEYYRMGELGWFTDQRVELIDGEVVQMPPKEDVHVACVSLAAKEIARAFEDGFWVRQQEPLRLSESSEPEPDVAVVRGSERDYIGTGHPTSALFVLEVADTTLAYDLGPKASLYAAAGIADVWIIDLTRMQLHVHRDPVLDPTRRFGSRYGSVTSCGRGEQVRPLATPAAIRIDDILP